MGPVSSLALLPPPRSSAFTQTKKCFHSLHPTNAGAGQQSPCHHARRRSATLGCLRAGAAEPARYASRRPRSSSPRVPSSCSLPSHNVLRSSRVPRPTQLASTLPNCSFHLAHAQRKRPGTTAKCPFGCDVSPADPHCGARRCPAGPPKKPGVALFESAVAPSRSYGQKSAPGETRRPRSVVPLSVSGSCRTCEVEEQLRRIGGGGTCVACVNRETGTSARRKLRGPCGEDQHLRRGRSCSVFVNPKHRSYSGLHARPCSLSPAALKEKRAPISLSTSGRKQRTPGRALVPPAWMHQCPSCQEPGASKHAASETLRKHTTELHPCRVLPRAAAQHDGHFDSPAPRSCGHRVRHAAALDQECSCSVRDRQLRFEPPFRPSSPIPRGAPPVGAPRNFCSLGSAVDDRKILGESLSGEIEETPVLVASSGRGVHMFELRGMSRVFFETKRHRMPVCQVALLQSRR